MEIQIRHAEPDDYEAIHIIYTQPKVVWGTLQLPYSSSESRRQRLAQPNEGSYALVACVDGAVVGHLSLRTAPNSPRRKHVGSLGMGVHDGWQGKGVGSALVETVINLADNWLNLSRLELDVYADNEAAVHIYRKYGFEVEGTQRCFAFRGGKYVDAYRMARLSQTATL